jgi:hypothetical protein
MRKRQQGMTAIGMLCVAALVGVIAYAGIRLVPVYLNYMKVSRTMDSVATEFKGTSADETGIRRSLEKHWGIEDITSVDFKEIEIQKGDTGVTLHVAYEDTVPYIANVSLAVSFDKTVKVE